MADLLSVTASVTALLTLCYQVGCSAVSLASGIAEIDGTIADLFAEIEELQTVTENIRSILESDDVTITELRTGTGHEAQHWPFVDRVLTQSHRMISALQKDIFALQAVGEGSFSGRANAHFRSVFSERRIKGYFNKIQGCKDTLQVSLQLLILLSSIAGRKSPEDISPRPDEIMILVKKVYNSLIHRQEDIDNSSTHPYQAGDVDIDEENSLAELNIDDITDWFDIQYCIECVKNAEQLVSMIASMITEFETSGSIDFAHHEIICDQADNRLRRVSSTSRAVSLANDQLRDSVSIINDVLQEFETLERLIGAEEVTEAENQCMAVIDAVKSAYGSQYKKSTLFERALLAKSNIFRMRGLLDDADAWLTFSEKLRESRLAHDEWEIVGVPRANSIKYLHTADNIPPQPNTVATFLNSIRKADIQKVRTIVNQYPGIVNCHFKGETPLHWAVWFRTPDIVKFLMYHGAKVNSVATVSVRNTPLHHAANLDDVYIIGLLIEGGANADAIDKYSWTPLHYAVYNNNLEATRALLSHGASVDYIEKLDKWTPLNYAVNKGEILLVKTLVEAGANINRKDASGKTPLMQSGEKGRDNISRLLVQLGADSSLVDDNMGSHLGISDEMQATKKLKRRKSFKRSVTTRVKR
ncbi:hypothetical protein TWF694_000305 [Orbilia ellipsospora]|uniref:Fungal N-terminal domain-containing protein n=1 Tax=Orbilia ellipsospora TaxID=2528407 RepID=A0AAV9XPZ0_9PEZI